MLQSYRYCQRFYRSQTLKTRQNVWRKPLDPIQQDLYFEGENGRGWPIPRGKI